jgi:hypothetical protein
MRVVLILMAIIGAASLIEVWWYPHYGAPFLAVLLILVAQSMRYLRQWKYHGREVGRLLVSAMPVAVIYGDDCLRSRGDCDSSDGGSD